MSISYIKLFNQTTDDFFKELIEIFPEETRIKVNYSLFQGLCKSNAKKPCNDFMLNSIPYLQQIAMRDENFFIGSGKLDFLTKMNFEKIWTPSLSNVTKNAIWNYIQSFFTIGIHIIEMPQESLQLINYIINYK
jgi:hypothetical protein